MNLAIINNQTNIVENVIVPPSGSNAYFLAAGFYGVLSEVAGIGDTYDSETEEFTSPPEPEPQEE